MNVTIDSQNGRDFERARNLYYRRIGHMNLACAHCHDLGFPTGTHYRSPAVNEQKET